MTRKVWGVVACLVCTTPCVSLGAMFQVDDFQGGTVEGWGGQASPTLIATGGPDGAGDAFLQLASTGASGPGSHLATNNEGSDWMGDISALGAVAVSVDLMSPETSQDLEMRLVLFGPADDNNRWTSTVAADVPNDGVWRNFVFSLDESDLTFVPRFPSSATYDQMIVDVIKVMLRHDAGSPSSMGTAIAATIGIDNVRFFPPPIPGDGNADGWVDGLDYLLWAGQFGTHPGTGGGPGNGDYNDDGWVDGLDYLTWAGNYGAHNQITAVPEPAAFWLTLFGGAALLHRSRRREDA